MPAASPARRFGSDHPREGTTSKTAIITGATRGIGRATAVALARRGYDLVVTGRTRHEGDSAALPEARAMPEVAVAPGSLDSTVALIEAEGGRATPVVLDLLDAERLVPAAEEAIAALGHVDLLLNNAIYVGPGSTELFLDTAPDDIAKRVFGNVTAQLIFTQPVLRHMVGRGTGTIVGMTSAAGYEPPTRRAGEGGWAAVYGVSKAAFTRIAAQLAVEHPELRFYNVQPGFVTTERVRAAGEKLAFVADRGAPVELIGEATARILDAPPGTFANGATIEVQDLAREWGLLPG
ncbi:MAG TPA: SDR family oxidoreductase [Acidimicrobiales bacterium]|nr:SDR family oxidoreductase [Acidimicrobiales bacterium]